MGEPIIRKMTHKDVQQVFQVQCACYEPHLYEIESTFRSKFTRFPDYFFVVEHNNHHNHNHHHNNHHSNHHYQHDNNTHHYNIVNNNIDNNNNHENSHHHLNHNNQHHNNNSHDNNSNNHQDNTHNNTHHDNNNTEESNSNNSSNNNNSSVIGYIINHPWFNDVDMDLHDELETIPSKPFDVWYIHDMAVLKDFRSLNLGTKLFDLVVAQCKSRNLSKIKLVALEPAIPFWTRKGFKIIEHLEDETSYGKAARMYLEIK